MIDDIFCKIINGDKKEGFVADEDEWIAINDLHPSAPIHVLIIPKKHIASLDELEESDERLMGKLIIGAHKIAKKLGLDGKGYRLIANCGEHGGQMVPHLHIHLIGGRKLGSKIIQD